jgi:hypothetical protein
MTRISSWWNHLQCRRCGHTFRRGDMVRVDQAARTVEHLVPGLRCGLPADAAGGVDEIAGFREGLMSTWPVPAGPRMRRLEPDDWRIPEGPGDLRDANVCLHCGHTFRPGEYVVVCPCQPEQPSTGGPPRAAACGRAVHRDPAAGLCCWESWQPDGVVTVCPVTQTRVDGA